ARRGPRWCRNRLGQVPAPARQWQKWRPSMEPFSSRTSEWGAAGLYFGVRLGEQAVVELDVQFGFLDRDLLLVGAPLGVGFIRVREIPSADFLVIAERSFELALFSADESPGIDLDRHEVVGVHVVVENVAVLQRHSQFVSIGAFDRLSAEVFDLVSLG